MLTSRVGVSHRLITALSAEPTKTVNHYSVYIECIVDRM